MRRRACYNIREHRVRYFFDELWDAKWELLKLVKRLAIVGFIGTASYNYLFKAGDSPKASLKNRFTQLEKISVIQDFKENWRQSKLAVKDMIDEHRWANSPEGKRQAAEARRIRKEREKDLDEMFGKDEWRIKYAKTDKEKQEARQFMEDLMNDRIR
jgi:hypothetical protein